MNDLTVVGLTLPVKPKICSLFALLFPRIRQQNGLNYVPHVQHDYLSYISALVSLYFGVLVVSAVVLAQALNRLIEIHAIGFGSLFTFYNVYATEHTRTFSVDGNVTFIKACGWVFCSPIRVFRFSGIFSNSAISLRIRARGKKNI